MSKKREGPKVSIDLECRGCRYLKICAGMCDTHCECEKAAWKGVRTIRGHGWGIEPPKECPFRRKAIRDFKNKQRR